MMVKKKTTKRRRARIDDWEAEGAADILMRAEEIRTNKALLNAVKRRLAKKTQLVDKAMKKK